VSPLPRSHIDTELELRLVVPDAGTVCLQVGLSYDVRDPFAVSAAFAGEGATIDWVFARDLLVDGLQAPAGEGDVHVWPSRSDGRDNVLISLCSPDGRAVLEADARDLRAFLDRTLDMVPVGWESRYVDIDAELAGLFR
jgi:Streptomyces sporulation and cell division protein, SsgA